ncbi:hypothetical protein EMIT0P74_120007 [Pseudomonas sp. IT-P74]
MTHGWTDNQKEALILAHVAPPAFRGIRQFPPALSFATLLATTYRLSYPDRQYQYTPTFNERVRDESLCLRTYLPHS